MKVSKETPTNIIFIALMDYRIDHESKEGSKYGFGYYKFDDFLIQKLNQFHDNWEKGTRHSSGVVIDIPDMFLINRAFIYDKVYNKEDFDYDGIKLDSINFLESKPTFDYPIMIKGSGYIIAFRNGFYIQCEDIVEKGISLTIYRSAFISYRRINHLLQRKEPI